MINVNVRKGDIVEICLMRGGTHYQFEALEHAPIGVHAVRGRITKVITGEDGIVQIGKVHSFGLHTGTATVVTEPDLFGELFKTLDDYERVYKER